MATWTTIPNTVLETGKPIRAVDGRALRDNPIAIAEGATGAPKVTYRALEALAPGTIIRFSRDAEESVTGEPGGSETILLGFCFMQTGTVRITFEHRVSSGSGSARVFRRRDAATTQLTSYSDTGTYVLRTLDVSVKPFDYVYITKTTSGGGTSFARNSRIQTSGVTLWPAGGSNDKFRGTLSNA